MSSHSGDVTMAQLVEAMEKMMSNQTAAISAAVKDLGDRLVSRIDESHSVAFRLSEVSIEDERVILHKLGLGKRVVPSDSGRWYGSCIDDAYKWTDASEPAQATNYRRHFIEQLGINKRRVHVVEKKRKWKLEASFPDHKLKLNGFTDMVILRNGAVDNSSKAVLGACLTFAHVCVEVKKPSVMCGTRSSRQALAQLIALDQVADGLVVSIATDLCDNWTFYWLGL